MVDVSKHITCKYDEYLEVEWYFIERCANLGWKLLDIFYEEDELFLDMFTGIRVISVMQIRTKDHINIQDLNKTISKFYSNYSERIMHRILITQKELMEQQQCLTNF